MCKGAIRRAGGDASGLSGTNYAARNTIDGMRRISSAADLHFGDVVLKGRKPGESGYNLPDKYKSGSDLTDYYHIGTVTGTNPLEITHMTSPKARIDTVIGKWAYGGRLKQVEAADPEPSPEPSPEPEPKLPTLRRGDKGEYVVLAQTKLIQRGYDLAPYYADGQFGWKTEAAVLQFQRDWELVQDGIIGKRTWEYLNKTPVHEILYTVTIRHVNRSTADEIIRKYGGKRDEEA